MRIAGVDIGGKSVKVGIFEEGVGLSGKCARPTPKGAERVADMIVDMLSGEQFDLLGVGTAGSVDFSLGTVCTSNLEWVDVPLRAMLEARFAVPVWVDNDAQAGMMAEWYDGALKGVSCGVCLTLGTGIGGAVLVDGKPWRGQRNLAAEFGHMTTHAFGVPCNCGRAGCLECYASATALEKASGDGRTAQMIIDAAQHGDVHSKTLFDAFVRELCLGLCSIIMAFDPEVIVLGGGISGAGEFLRGACEQELARIFAPTTDRLICRIRLAAHRNDAGILGAAILAKHKLNMNTQSFVESQNDRCNE